MNVLILTPDAVGSTLLQRLLTIYMQFHQYDKPVINLHELTNGLIKYYSSDFNRELLGKPRAKWGYYQSLSEIVEFLSTTDHYKTSRLAQYHIRNRQDPIEQQIPFYNYLNENFYIIACRRENVFEHAVSWAINKVTKKLNVYTPEEKINTFFDLFNEPIELDINSMLDSLEDYRNYLEWSDNHFSIASYFEYEKHLPNMERYILNLPMFSGQTKKLGWNDVYGMTFQDWNRCHYYTSNIGSIAMNKKDIKLLENKRTSRDLVNYLPADQKTFVEFHQENYYKVNESIQRMQELGILVSTVPIKKQTLAEKRFMVKNFDQCVDVYNQWISQYPLVGSAVDPVTLEVIIEQEQSTWQPTSTVNAITV